MQLPDLNGKVAIVTGSGSGIGRASAQYLGSQGVAVVVADVNDAGAEQTVEMIRGAGGRALAHHTDVSDGQSIRATVAAAVDEFGGLQLLHNNAGVNLGPRDPDAVSMDVDGWDETMAINLRGAMLFCKYAIPQMLEAGGGAIVFTSSISGQVAEPSYTAYSASKGGIDALTRSVATHYGRRGIRANAVAPGLIATEGVKSILPPEMKDVYIRNQLIPRLGEPSDIAVATAFLLSEAAGFITGQVLNVDGGFLAHDV
jgi:NAD(P)-dependent dehydrogenase (short-subunit alcohol dehydrogenase family)